MAFSMTRAEDRGADLPGAERARQVLAGFRGRLYRCLTRRGDELFELGDAIRARNYQWVLECDIKACFDEISHTALMDRLRARIKDKRVCALVKAFLKSGVLTNSETGKRH